MRQVHLFISGIVQGVGFRQFVKSHARKMGLTGWVRNLEDGRVEVIAQGQEKRVEKLISLCEQGSLLSEVSDISITWEDQQESFEVFLIR